MRDGMPKLSTPGSFTRRVRGHHTGSLMSHRRMLFVRDPGLSGCEHYGRR